MLFVVFSRTYFLILSSVPITVTVLHGFDQGGSTAYSDARLSTSPSSFSFFILFLAVLEHLFLHINSKILLPNKSLLGFQLGLHEIFILTLRRKDSFKSSQSLLYLFRVCFLSMRFQFSSSKSVALIPGCILTSTGEVLKKSLLIRTGNIYFQVFYKFYSCKLNMFSFLFLGIYSNVSLTFSHLAKFSYESQQISSRVFGVFQAYIC